MLLLAESFLGPTPFYISMDWEMNAVSLGCVPFGGSHTALKTLDLIKEVNYKLYWVFHQWLKFMLHYVSSQTHRNVKYEDNAGVGDFGIFPFNQE